MENLPTIIKNITDSKRIAIVIPAEASVDAFCSAIALQTAVGKAMIFCSAPVPELLFLPNVPSVYPTLKSSDQLAIKISSKNASPKEVRYDKTDSGLTIYITPDKGQFAESDVSVLPAVGNFDLLVIIGAGNFEQLGKVYTENPKLFFDTPHINIDNSPNNEFYGTLNFVNTTASSLSEVVMDIIEALPGGINNDTVATSLLAGIISQTSSFRDPKTTPTALQKASRLVTAGGRQKEIIQHLFKTKSLQLLQLWGRALARLTAQPDKQTLTAVVTASDLQKTQMSVESLPTVLRDIVEMVTGFSFVVFLAELPDVAGVQILLAGMPNENLISTAQQLSNNVVLADSIKSLILVGQYHYVSIHVKDSLIDVQTRLTALIENRNSVL
ncbi:MAG TPA: hypothetical protein VHQ20_02180 [Patescibacteria group bacterium]|jgi:nanoRNase/pAp phosphatase (c-di-AMP/oligoRNAs hydrolase)|nr:hypothetical protein [Patescibacteria group bacterium]